MKNTKFSEEIFKQLINTSAAAMFVVDENRNILFANDSFAKMFGYTIEEVINVNTRKFHLNDESYEEFATIAFDAVSKGNPVDIEFEVKRKDGSFFWIHIVGSLVENEKLISSNICFGCNMFCDYRL
jgi:PAS domain S-box-containing protein